MRNSDAMRQRWDAVMMHNYGTPPVALASGDGALVTDVDGKTYVDLLGAQPAEIVFSSGGTEADNLAIFGTVHSGDHVITSTIEHHAVLNACNHLAENGCEVTCIGVDASGRVDPDDVKE